MTTDPQALLPQVLLDSGTAVAPLRVTMRGLNLSEQILILLRPSADRSLTPRREATAPPP